MKRIKSDSSGPQPENAPRGTSADLSRLCRELEQVVPVYPGSPNTGEVLAISELILDEGVEPERAMREIWGWFLDKAPLGMFPLIRPEMLLAKVPAIAERLKAIHERGYQPRVAVDLSAGPASTGNIEQDLLAQVYRQKPEADSEQ